MVFFLDLAGDTIGSGIVPRGLRFRVGGFFSGCVELHSAAASSNFFMVALLRLPFCRPAPFSSGDNISFYTITLRNRRIILLNVTKATLPLVFWGRVIFSNTSSGWKQKNMLWQRFFFNLYCEPKVADRGQYVLLIKLQCKKVQKEELQSTANMDFPSFDWYCQRSP